MQQEQIETTKAVYGDTFAVYDREEFLEFLHPLEMRLKANNIPLSIFEGKRCLDAGCGGGRGSVLMARAGAKEVVSFDLSEKNIQTTQRNAGLFNLKNVHTVQGSLLSLDFKDDEFDIVWCNGVLHHTSDPDKSLQEVCRVLKPGGHMWLYLYGSGGLYWYMVDLQREWLKDLDMHMVIAALTSMGYSTTHVAEFIDDWYVPHLKRYTHADVAARLEELGMEATPPLPGGMAYDTSVRLAGGDPAIWMGEGDLRYWVTKRSARASEGTHPLPDVNSIGSDYKEDQAVLAFREDFEKLFAAARDYGKAYPELDVFNRIAVAARSMRRLLEQFNNDDVFDADAYRAFLEYLCRKQRESITAKSGS